MSRYRRAPRPDRLLTRVARVAVARRRAVLGISALLFAVAAMVGSGALTVRIAYEAALESLDAS